MEVKGKAFSRISDRSTFAIIDVEHLPIVGLPIIFFSGKQYPIMQFPKAVFEGNIRQVVKKELNGYFSIIAGLVLRGGGVSVSNSVRAESFSLSTESSGENAVLESGKRLSLTRGDVCFHYLFSDEPDCGRFNGTQSDVGGYFCLNFFIHYPFICVLSQGGFFCLFRSNRDKKSNHFRLGGIHIES